MAKTVLSGHIVVSRADLDAVRSALPAHVAATLAEAGCLVFKVCESATEIGRFDVYEEFIDRVAFEVHQVRVKGSDWGKVSQNAQRFYEVREEE